MLRPEAQSDEREGVDLSVVVQILVGLEAFQSINRIVIPLSVRVTFEIASIRKRFLDLGVTATVWV